ncbi:MAG TPA: outer membrane protein assembly factor BamD [Balneolales bacterium]|nr:outer membrane protein assembly factor BamD [Balneolales bacterium]
MNKRLKFALKAGLFLTVIFTQACANKYAIKRGDSLRVAYNKAMTIYKEHKYDDASQAFQTVLSLGRGTGYAKDAQYYLAQSYFNDKQYLLAASEYKRYYTYYPKDKRREEVQFKQALCYYKLSPNYNLDQSKTEKAIELYQLFISRYPNSKLSNRAGKYIDQMRDKLARKMLEAARLYQRLRDYKASALYFGLTIDNYPETKWAQVALAEQVHAYVLLAQNSISSKQEERFNKAVDTYQKYTQLFPKGNNRHEAEHYYKVAKEALNKISKQNQRTAANE